MKSNLYGVRLALTALVTWGMVLPGIAQAQQPSQEFVPFKATLAGTLPSSFTIPLDAPLVADNSTLTGEASEIGPVTFVEHSIAQLTLDGRGFSVPYGVGVLTAANGDAIFLTFSGLVRPAGLEAAYTVTGGRGRFKGATGQGVFLCVRDRPNNRMTRTFEGVISRPKP
jgi:hypothetical protein